MSDPLTNSTAFACFLDDFEKTLNANEEKLKKRSSTNPPQFCFRRDFLAILFALIVLLFVGAVELDNTISISLFISSSFLLIIFIFLLLLNSFLCNSRLKKRLFQAKCILNSMKKIDAGKIYYERILEPPSEEWICHWVERKGNPRPITIPTLLLAKGDCLLLRPGQAAPCLCQTKDGITVEKGKRLAQQVERDVESGGAIPLEPVKCSILESPIALFLNTALERVETATPLDLQIDQILNRVLLKFFLPLALVVAMILAIFRFITSDGSTLFGKRFVFAVPSTMILPLMCPIFPIFFFINMLWNNAVVMNFLQCGNIKMSTSIFRVIGTIFRRIADKNFTSTDLVSIFGSLTAICFVDKKGIVSSPNPILDKLFFFTKHLDELEQGVETKSPVIPEVLDMSGEKVGHEWILDFDDPNWDRFSDSLLPIGQNIRLNGCQLQDDYLRFLDHATCVAETVPRTIAVASRRCLCQLPMILNLEESPLKQASPPQSIALYKRVPGQEAVPGLMRHRTPLEGIFCAIHADERSLHVHLAAQGTATVILNSCSHIWNGSTLDLLTNTEKRAALDFYNRHSMTGYCLALSYRAVGELPSEKLSKQYLEVGAGGRLHPPQSTQSSSSSIPLRSHSTESLSHEHFFDNNKITKSTQLLDAYFEGHVFCGMVVMQYQAEPSIVSLVESIEADAIRFVYFSRENELRSRVFAEKLGLEAGWNCHVSLAEGEHHSRENQIFASLYRKSSQNERKRNESQLSLPIETEHCLAARYAPFMRTLSRSGSGKMGPLLNKAQLPQGVSAVRPHLEQIDNVPLQVGLFTDAHPKATKEMILIMQEYGEIVIVVGSALNTSNAQIFAQSNASICLQPLRDRCHAGLGGRTPKTHLNAIDLISSCMELAVDFHLKHQQLSALPNLISAARHRLYSIRCSLQFLLFLSISLSLIVALSTALFLPIIFKPDQILLFSCLIFPLAALSPLSNSFAPREKFVKIAGKNIDHVNKKEIFASIWTFTIQFLLTVFFTILLYFLLLVRHVNFECEFSDLVCSVGETDGFPNTTVSQLDLSTEQVRHLVAFQLIIATIVHSASWTAPLFSMYNSFPFFKPYWLFTSTLIILIQLIFTKISLGQTPFAFFTTPSTLFLIVWSLLIAIINEGRKFTQRRLFMREQRRRKLAFDTKLGMNSPY